MSYSSLFGINGDYVGEEISKYRNPFLFSPVIWDILSDKTLPRYMGYIQHVIGLGGMDVWKKINNIMNKSDDMVDRICWEIPNQNIFFTKDKSYIAKAIRDFVIQNKQYDKSEYDGLPELEREHIIERFNEIATDIEKLDEEKYPYFVFKNTSVDDQVECWFNEYNEETDEYREKSLREWDKILTEFVVIEDGKIIGFINNLDYDYE